MRKSLFLFLFFLISSEVLAQWHIDSQSFGIDEQRKIILINQDLQEINDAHSGLIGALTIGGKPYYFQDSQEELQTAQQYTVYKAGEEYKLFFTDLPLIRIQTTGEIVDTPAVLGNIELKIRDEQMISSLIGIEYRGATSQGYPKKSMEIEFWLDEQGNATQDFSFLDLKKDDGWNLQAMYSEGLRIKSKTANDLWQKIHPDVHYKSDEPEARSGVMMRYTEIFVNGEYMGIYAVGEKVNRSFLKLKKADGNEIKGELYKAADWTDATLFAGTQPYDNNSDEWFGYEYKHPKGVIDWSNLFNLINYVSTSDDFQNGYSQKFDVNNLVDYFIFMNLIRAMDNSGKNLYLAKYKKNSPYYYVPWDLDATFGTNWNGEILDVTDDLLTNKLYERLWENEDFRNQLSERWIELRQNIATKDYIGNMLDENYQLLAQNGVYLREKLRWEANDSEEKLHYMKDWLDRRISFLDEVFIITLSATDITSNEQFLKIYPNPSSEKIVVDFGKGDVWVEIFDLSGKSIKKINTKSKAEISIASLKAGMYILKVSNGIQTESAKFIKK